MKFTAFILSLLLPVFIHAAPIVTSVSPVNGSVAGGNTVQIAGSGFTGTTAIHFGTVPAVTFTVISDTSITVTAPATFAAGTIDITVTTGSGTSPISSADEYTYIDGTWYAYVGMFNTQFQAVNLTTLQLSTPQTLTGAPPSITVTPNGQLALVPGGPPFLSNINLATLLANPPVSLVPHGLKAAAISLDGTTAYLLVTNPINGVLPYNIASQTPGTLIPVAASVFDIALTPDGKTVYVTSATGTYPVDLTTSTVGTSIPSPQGHIRITPDGTRAFLSNSSGDAVYIDLATNIPFGPISTPSGTSYLAINPDGKTVYYLTNDGHLLHFDTTTLATGPAIAFPPGQLFAIGVTPDGKTGFVQHAPTAGFGLLYPIDLTTYAISPAIVLSEAGPGPTVVVSPDQAPIASFTVIAGLSGLPSFFDASASVSPVGTIVNYAWDFGDGDTLDTSTPFVSHFYALPGSYTVTLTVTNSAGTSTTQTYTGQMVSNNGGPSAQTSQIVQISTLLPPQNVHAFQVENKFLMQDEIRNVIVWNAPTQGVPPVRYNIYSDAALTNLLAIIPAGRKLEFVQHNVHERPYTYYLISVDVLGNVSVPVSVTVNPKKERHSSS